MKKNDDLINGFYTDYDRLSKNEEEKKLISEIYRLHNELSRQLNDEQNVLLECLLYQKLQLEKMKAGMFAKALINYVLEKE